MGRRKARQKRIRCVPKASRYCAFGSWSWTKLQGITVHRLLSARSHCAKKETLTSYTRGKIASRHIFSFSAVCACSSTVPVTSQTTETERRELARGVRLFIVTFSSIERKIVRTPIVNEGSAAISPLFAADLPLDTQGSKKEAKTKTNDFV